MPLLFFAVAIYPIITSKKVNGFVIDGHTCSATAKCFYGGREEAVYHVLEKKQALELFVKEKHIKTIPFPQGIPFTFSTRFFVHNQSIYHTTVSEKGPVISFGKDSIQRHPIGKYTKYDNISYRRHLTRHILKGDKCFFIIGCVYPTLQQYSLEGELMHEYDLSVIPDIKSMMKAYQNTYQDPNSYFSVIQDAYYRGGKVYLLIGTEGNGKYSCHTIGIINISNNQKEAISSFSLSGKVYDVFCIDDNKNLYAHNPVHSTIEIFGHIPPAPK